MLNAKSFGLSGGILWGASMFILTWLNILFSYSSMWTALMADAYPGYDVSAIGSFVGLIWGFIDGFVCLYIIARLYNVFNR